MGLSTLEEPWIHVPHLPNFTRDYKRRISDLVPRRISWVSKELFKADCILMESEIRTVKWEAPQLACVVIAEILCRTSQLFSTLPAFLKCLSWLGGHFRSAIREFTESLHLQPNSLKRHRTIPVWCETYLSIQMKDSPSIICTIFRFLFSLFFPKLNISNVLYTCFQKPFISCNSSLNAPYLLIFSK